MMIVVFTA